MTTQHSSHRVATRRSAASLVAGGLLLTSFACSRPPEQEQLLEQFFRALALEDRGTLAGLSMVAFPDDPPEQWELLAISGTDGPYRVPELREEEREATRTRDDQFQAFSAFRSANAEALRTIVERREARPEGPLGGRLGPIEEEWEAHREERRRVREALAEVQMALDAERRRAARSLLREAPVDYLTGSVGQQELRVRVDGERDYRFVLLRYELVNQFGDAVPSRWIIAAIEAAEPEAGSGTPPSLEPDPE